MCAKPTSKNRLFRTDHYKSSPADFWKLIQKKEKMIYGVLAKMKVDHVGIS